MSGARILLAEDDRNIREGLVDALEGEGYRVTAVENGEAALVAFRQATVDLLLLDVMMPLSSGYDVCREIRSKDRQVPIIMLTAKSEEIDKVVGLQLGADDYVTKPFGIRELLARIEAVLRRARPAAVVEDGTHVPEQFQFGEARVDTRRFQLTLGRKSHELSAREVELLRYFKAHAGEVLSRDELLNRLWGQTYYGTTRTLDQHVAQLRKKLRRKRGDTSCIATVHGVGYRYDGA